MNTKEMDKLIEHFNHYFEQSDPMVLHSDDIKIKPHIDILKYEPTEKYPFWKLTTMGAGDFKMKGKSSLGNRNEYIMFIDAGEDLEDKTTLDWYYRQLLEVALYPVSGNVLISYGHSVEWEPEESEEMVGAFLEFPQIIEDAGILHCKLGLMKTVICLQVTLLTRAEIDKLLEIGAEKFSEYLYPENEGKKHFLSQKVRTDIF